jgi:hypothetical protein
MLSDRRKVLPQTRNVLCPAYSICLSSAVAHNSENFTCADCSNQRKAEGIPAEEIPRAGMLLNWIFFHDEKETVITATCPRCGKRHRSISVPGGSTKRFCGGCQTFEISGGEMVYELRGQRMPVAPGLDDEPGFEETT